MNDNNKIVIICFSAMAGLVAGFALALLIFFFVGGSSEKTQPVVIDSQIPSPPSEEQSPQTKAAIQVIRDCFAGHNKDGHSLGFDTRDVLSYKIVECKPIDEEQDKFKVQLIIKEQAVGSTPTSRLDFILRYDKEFEIYVGENVEHKRIAVEEE